MDVSAGTIHVPVKTPLLLLLLGVSAACAETFPEWTTSTGKVYTNATVVEVAPDGIALRYDDGVTKVPFENLTAEQRDQYRLTAEGRDAYLAKKKERIATARAAEAERRAELPPPPPKRPAGNYLTVYDVKRQWALRIAEPGILDPDYNDAIRKRNDYMASLRNGSRDRDALKLAAQLNRVEALRVGDTERAKQEEDTLAEIEREEQAEKGNTDVPQPQQPDAPSQPGDDSSSPPVTSDPGWTDGGTQSPVDVPCPDPIPTRPRPPGPPIYTYPPSHNSPQPPVSPPSGYHPSPPSGPSGPSAPSHPQPPPPPSHSEPPHYSPPPSQPSPSAPSPAPSAPPSAPAPSAPEPPPVFTRGPGH